MKVAVLNFSGNVGKTTVAVHLLQPRMGNAPIYSIESLNSDASADGVDVEQLRGRQFGELSAQLLTLDNAIVDVGASNIEDFLRLMAQYEGSHEDYDYFVVPVVKERKQQADSVNTLQSLVKLGVTSDRVRVVFNKLDVGESVEESFSAIVGLARVSEAFVLNPEAAIDSNEVYELLKTVGKPLNAVAVDQTDYRSQLRIAISNDTRDACVRMILLKRLAVTANRNLDRVFTALFDS